MLLSIVVPFYNATTSLSKTVETLREQTFSDIEIIMVDDGSTDDSLTIAKKLAKKDKRIIILRQENSGVSSARNQGIKLAQGRYVTFVDADDLLDRSMYKELMADVSKFDVDVIFSGMRVNGSAINDLPENESLLNGHHQIRRVLIRRLLGDQDVEYVTMPSACRMIIDRKMLLDNSIQFNSAIGYHEDFVFCISTLMEASKVYIDQRQFYNYLYDEKGRKRRHILKKKIFSHIQVLHFLIKLYSNACEDIRENINISIIRFLSSACENICHINRSSLIIQYETLKNLHKDIKPSINDTIKYSRVSLKSKIISLSFSKQYFLLVIIVYYFSRIKACCKS